MREFTIILFLLLSIKLFACDCEEKTLLQKIQNCDFIAVGKVLKISPDVYNRDYHNIQIELINVFKGQHVTSLKILSKSNSSCSFFTPENSTWLIFASFDMNNILSFGQCSGSREIDRKFVSQKYPYADSNYKKTISLKMEILEFMKINNIQSTNPYDLEISYCQNCWKALKGFNNQNKFAVYEATINSDLSINKLIPLKEFSNHKLKTKLFDCIKNNLVIYNNNNTILPIQSKLILVYYFYPADKKYPSFISIYDL
ncbi:MAG: hypothetical protein IPH98_16095 [Saprospiraceae bacterium]|nr:hypothetical protein [Candidatus Defluviibacterium haderslevense]